MNTFEIEGYNKKIDGLRNQGTSLKYVESHAKYGKTMETIFLPLTILLLIQSLTNGPKVWT